LKLSPSAAFQAFVEELAHGLGRLGLQFQPGPGGRVTEGSREVATVVRWQPPDEIALEWHPADWNPAAATFLEVRFLPVGEGSRIVIGDPGWGRMLGDEGYELAGWFVSAVAAPLLSVMAPRRFGDWITDRRARRPSGPEARAFYRDPIYHRPNFKAILAVLNLQPDDYLLEVGCGGGAFLHDALLSGCRAAAIDHSSDMVKLAREANPQPLGQRRWEIREGNAESLPFPDGTFTCAVMTGVFGFIADPARVLSEVLRVLQPGGRFVLFTGSKELRGTPAAPEPIASRLHFYEDEELLALVRQAGWTEAHLEHPDFATLAREAGVPEEAWGLFQGRGGQLLVARR
jgi:SAM-dependent methyltransferase